MTNTLVNTIGNRCGNLMMLSLINNQTERTKRLVDKYATLISYTIHNISAVNDICCSLMIETNDAITKSNIYKHEVKKIAKEIDRERAKYEKVINYTLRNYSDEFAESNDVFYDEYMQQCVKDLNRLFCEKIKMHNIPNADLMAMIETTRTMIDFACAQYKLRQEEFKLHGIEHIMKRLESMDISHILRLYEKLMDNIHIGCRIELNTDDCKAAFKKINKASIDMERLLATRNCFIKNNKDEDKI